MNGRREGYLKHLATRFQHDCLSSSKTARYYNSSLTFPTFKTVFRSSTCASSRSSPRAWPSSPPAPFPSLPAKSRSGQPAVARKTTLPTKSSARKEPKVQSSATTTCTSRPSPSTLLFRRRQRKRYEQFRKLMDITYHERSSTVYVKKTKYTGEECEHYKRKAEDDGTLAKRQGLALFAADVISKGCECLNLHPRTVTKTYTPPAHVSLTPRTTIASLHRRRVQF
jgi:hypothetical protein